MRVNKWGNSLGVRFPNEFVAFVGLSEKSFVEIKTNDEQQLVITKIKEEKPRERPTIQELFKLYPAEFIHDEEIDWGEPTGDEVW